ncbi:MAG TPA: response regulator [Vicinamibacteria bacterium]|jgi:two-component system cell cycle sensor histidine kinase/response regulator CckA|nr:response regulator [Vicinamibacteria bacterium]
MTSPTILLVEDNPITRKMLRFALEAEGYDVVDTADGRAALEASAARRPDLLVLDFVLPDTDGLRLLAEIRSRTAAPELPAIVVTGMVSRLEELQAVSGVSTQFLAKPVEPSRLLEVVRSQLSAPEGQASGRRVLVVDDELLNRKLASFRLKQAGYEVEMAAGGAEGLELARRRPPDAILADVMMPSMDGFTFCGEARREPVLAAIPIVLVSSAYVDEADRDLARKMGANALVVRTPDLRDAAAALDEHLRRTGPPPAIVSDARVTALHRERLQVQLERQSARNEVLLRQAAIQATALSIIRGLSEVLAQPKDVTQIIGDVLVHCLDAAGLSTGLLYLADPGGGRRLQAQFGIPADRKADAEVCFGHPELIRRIVEGGHAVAFSAGTASADPDMRDFLARLGQSSALVVPFVVLGETFGELVLASDSHDLSENAWTGFARTLALQFGQTVALGQSLNRAAASEGRYRALMEQAKDAICVLNQEGVILEANHQMERLLALPHDRLIGRHISDFAPFPVVETPENVRQFQETVASGGGRNENVLLRRGDGALVEVDFSMSVNEIEGKAYVLSIGRDVTERNRVAAALRDAQQRLHHLVSSSPAVLYSLRVEAEKLIPTWASENIERLSGYTPEDVTTPDWWDERVHPADRAGVLAQLPILLSKGYVVREYRFRYKDGTYGWIRDEQVLIPDERGQPEVVGSWSDVTPRKDAELRLQQSEQQYRLLFDSNPHPVAVFDQETFAFLAVNDASLRHYGYSRDEFLAMTVKEIRVPEEVPALLTDYDRSRDKTGDATYQVLSSTRHRKKGGSVIEVEIAASPITFQGRPAWLALVSDVTEKRSLEAQLLQSQKMESMGRLAGGVAHDFNNLLGIITGYAGLMRKSVSADPRLAKYVDDIVKAAERAAGLTRQLLAFSRKQVLQPRILDLNAVVGETENMLRRLIGEDIQLLTVCDDQLGPVRADPGQMDQVLMNLAVNARDAMPRGGRLTIETGNVALDRTYAGRHAGVEPGRYVMLAVSDTGHGMTPEVQARVFEPFFTTKELGKGTGLGLATVHGIVKQSGGHIWVYSEPDNGTTFKIYLPRADAPEADAQTPPPAEGELPRGSETILLVEDEASLRGFVRECLEAAGYTVLEARHGVEALKISQRHPAPVHLLLTDVVMPLMSGRELAQEIRASRPEVRVLYMSGYTDDAVVLHGVLAADMAFLQKPFTAEMLARRVREVLD